MFLFVFHRLVKLFIAWPPTTCIQSQQTKKLNEKTEDYENALINLKTKFIQSNFNKKVNK